MYRENTVHVCPMLKCPRNDAWSLDAAPCDVHIQSVGYWESETTYVKLNDYYPLELASPADENDQECGTYTVLLDKVSPSSCVCIG